MALPKGLGRGRTPRDETPVYSVSQLNSEVRTLLEGTYPLIWVEGEVSNFTHHRSGHMYLTLKDEGAQVDAAMFKSANQRLDFLPENGMSVLALVQPTLYEPRGRYQVVVQRLQEAGLGRLQRAFEQLKAKLQAEGLFDPERKRSLPPFPTRVGIVTSEGAAALRDMFSVLSRRYPVVEALLFPAAVQGSGAGAQLAEAVERANRYSADEHKLDVLIVGRGGGSLEDLWAFNEERLARAIAASRVPVVSAVGHEVDVTIADFVADVRAPTPSAAAEQVVPDTAELVEALQTQARQLVRLCVQRWTTASERLAWLKRSHGLRRPRQRLQDAAQMLDYLKAQLTGHARQRWQQQQQRHTLLLSRLDTANPASILGRGYAMVTDEAGRPIKQSAQVKPGQRLGVRLGRGSLNVRVEEVGDD